MSARTVISVDPKLCRSIPEIDAEPGPEQVTLFRRTGVAVVRGLLSREETDRIRDAFMDVNGNGVIPSRNADLQAFSGKAACERQVQLSRLPARGYGRSSDASKRRYRIGSRWHPNISSLRSR